ncbi:MAG: phage major capsid protein, partial [Gammaproteobacteria bacterium]|nr:phage major capsid protein [Gammaproteobacteria bacterium]
MDKELKDAIDGVNQTVGEMRKTNEELQSKIANGEGGQSELKASIDKMNTEIDKQEKANEELMTKLGAEHKANIEAKERIEEMELNISKLKSSKGVGPADKDAKLDAEKKALDEWAITHEAKADQMSQETKDYLRTDSNVDGGFLIQEQYDTEIIKPITETSRLRAFARNKRIAAGTSLNMGLRSSLVQGYWTGEGEDFTIGSSKYARPNVPVHGMTLYTEITNKDLLASPVNMGTEILSDFRERMAQIEGAGFVTGN